MQLPAPHYYEGSLCELIQSQRPLLDVRAPIEARKGGFPLYNNIPLLDDQQRQMIGTAYRKQGREQAIELGLKLATPAVKAARLDAWCAWLDKQPNAVLYCFRGGLRSRITQAWLRERGVDVPMVRGGFKALRQAMLAAIEQTVARPDWLVVAGRTGVGKTDVVEAASNSLDLEALAQHRGSAFGGYFQAQPTQIEFEHALAAACLGLSEDRPVVVEDEGRIIGRISVPQNLFERIKASPIVQVEASDQQRAERLASEYIQSAVTHFEAIDSAPWDAVEAYFIEGLNKIKKRLGQARHDALVAQMPRAVAALRHSEDWREFHDIVLQLLNEYYDSQYDYQLTLYQRPLKFRGGVEATIEYLNHAA